MLFAVTVSRVKVGGVAATMVSFGRWDVTLRDVGDIIESDIKEESWGSLPCIHTCLLWVWGIHSTCQHFVVSPRTEEPQRSGTCT